MPHANVPKQLSLSLQPLDLRPCLKKHAFMAMAHRPLRGLKSMSFKEERLNATDDASGPLLSAFLLRYILNDLNSQSSFLAFSFQVVQGCGLVLWRSFGFKCCCGDDGGGGGDFGGVVSERKVGTLMETTVVLPVTV